MLTEIRIDDYEGMIHKHAIEKMQMIPHIEYEELVAIGYLAFVEAKSRYKKKAKAKFGTYLWHYLHGYMMNEIKNSFANWPTDPDSPIFIDLEGPNREAWDEAGFLEGKSEVAAEIVKFVLAEPRGLVREKIIRNKKKSRRYIADAMGREGITQNKIWPAFREIKTGVAAFA